MPDEDTEDAGPAVSLGDGDPVDGAPLARVTSRLTWPKERSEIAQLEGESLIRTPGGPRRLADVLEEVDVPYFERRQEFVDVVRSVVGTGPVPTANE